MSLILKFNKINDAEQLVRRIAVEGFSIVCIGCPINSTQSWNMPKLFKTQAFNFSNISLVVEIWHIGHFLDIITDPIVEVGNTNAISKSYTTDVRRRRSQKNHRFKYILHPTQNNPSSLKFAIYHTQTHGFLSNLAKI